MDKTINNISVIGLGKLGASMAASFAHRGFNVIGVDVDPLCVAALNQGRAPVLETGLGELILTNRSRLQATLEYQTAIQESEISFIIVPTPSDERGAFSLVYAEQAFSELGRALRRKKDYHVIVMTSTVLPGSMRSVLIPLLERESGLKCGRDFGVCYNPEFIALGSVIKDFLNPDFYLLGEYDTRSGDMLESVHYRVSQNNARIKRLSLENAELAKIAVNSYVTMKISFANMLADFCEKIPGGDVDTVSDALGMDSRIGRKYLTGGPGFAGPCFPRDNAALAFIGEYLDVDVSLPSTNDSYNRKRSENIFKRIKNVLPTYGTVCVLGLSYKPLSHITELSSGVTMTNLFADAGYRVKAHDCLAANIASTEFRNDVVLTDNLDFALEGADIVLVVTDDKSYRALTSTQLGTDNREVFLVDFWRILEGISVRNNINYIPIGRCLDDSLAETQLRSLWLGKGAVNEPDFR
jgi:UDPglucose 6-dehydrogenase